MTPSPPPPGDQVREQLVSIARAFIVAEVGEDMGDGMTDQADRFADALLPAVSALLTEARADELEQAADSFIGWPGRHLAITSLRDRATHLRAAVRRTEGN